MRVNGVVIAQYVCTGTVLIAFAHPIAGGCLLALAALGAVIGAYNERRYYL